MKKTQCELKLYWNQNMKKKSTFPDVPVRIYVVNQRGQQYRITQCETADSTVYIVDSYVKIELNNIHYLQTHQKDLHVAQ
ncbi:hypothetical protein DAPPUDRAFT_259708 [Daphnia pulex]|uniref:Uncharacterized protein n=1 Tax=Daphnia pulex TaxID=6669 RepID=E9HHP7_DAPPU|nr:hypothetical protein DAPPUDRAFT_259708 [Daphnia pulex]|eukprot:EFX68756.1 hypothetical protein DAPPUDRAFT_259708 [Daphnia pulex]